LALQQTLLFGPCNECARTEGEASACHHQFIRERLGLKFREHAPLHPVRHERQGSSNSDASLAAKLDRDLVIGERGGMMSLRPG
jgi:hypothetical protein